MPSALSIVRRLLEADEELPRPPVGAETARADDDVFAEISDIMSGGTGQGVPVTLYREFSDILKNKDRRKLSGAATRLQREGDGSIALYYHVTPVLRAFPDEKVEVKTGGWYTVTTRSRINEYAPGGWRVYVKSGEHFWWNPSTGAGGTDDQYVYPFTSGDTINPDGKLISVEPPIFRRRRKKKSSI